MCQYANVINVPMGIHGINVSIGCAVTTYCTALTHWHIGTLNNY
jgi:hypothetical protein